jgi:hypothetical protein
LDEVKERVLPGRTQATRLLLCIKYLLLNLIYAEFLGEYYYEPLFYVVCQMQVSNKGVGFLGVLGLKVGI